MSMLLLEKYESNNDTIDFLQNSVFDNHMIEQSINAYEIQVGMGTLPKRKCKPLATY